MIYKNIYIFYYLSEIFYFNNILDFNILFIRLNLLIKTNNYNLLFFLQEINNYDLLYLLVFFKKINNYNLLFIKFSFNK